MTILLDGRARVLGDDINTDYIIASRRKRDTLDPQILKQYLLEEIDPAFAGSVEPGDILVAGKNFGCGSAMEVAATVVLGAGIKGVVAKSFSRTYYRNAINNGLLPLTADTSDIREGDRLAIERGDVLRIHNRRTGQCLVSAPMPQIMLDILDAGGLVSYFRAHQDFKV
jgi:3-isopropylmalate/(R)-2-methylmalate dehydratase small subunit